jgi:Ala-tRNA(Pro) deacylase
MAIARRLKWFMDVHGTRYEVLSHRHSSSSRESATKASIPPDQLAKPVLLEDKHGYLLAVLPATQRISMASLEEQTHRKLELATEDELEQIFFDCERGAIPPVGPAYGIPTVIDESLLRVEDIYLEGGDHEELVHLKAASFADLLAGSRHCSFAS